MIQNVLSKQSHIKLHQFLGTCTVIPLHSCLEFQELLVLSILRAGWGSFSSKWQRHSRTVFYLGTAALIFILRSPIKKLQAIPCRLSGEKKSTRTMSGYHELLSYTAETVHYLSFVHFVFKPQFQTIEGSSAPSTSVNSIISGPTPPQPHLFLL